MRHAAGVQIAGALPRPPGRVFSVALALRALGGAREPPAPPGGSPAAARRRLGQREAGTAYLAVQIQLHLLPQNSQGTGLHAQSGSATAPRTVSGAAGPALPAAAATRAHCTRAGTHVALQRPLWRVQRSGPVPSLHWSSGCSSSFMVWVVASRGMRRHAFTSACMHRRRMPRCDGASSQRPCRLHRMLRPRRGGPTHAACTGAQLHQAVAMCGCVCPPAPPCMRAWRRQRRHSWPGAGPPMH